MLKTGFALVWAAIAVWLVASPALAQGQVSMAAQISPTEALRGDVISVHVTVKNIGDGPVCLEGVVVSGLEGAYYLWAVVEYGSISYDMLTDAYTFNHMAQMSTVGRGMTSGLLLPGQEAAITLRGQVLDVGAVALRSELGFHAGTFEDFAQAIYVSTGDDFMRETYKHPSLDLLKDWKSHLELLRHVIMRPAQPAQSAVAEVTVTVKEREFGLENAATAAGVTPTAYHWSEWKQAWALQVDDGLWIVGPKVKAKYPGLTLPVLKFVEEDESVYFWVVPQALPEELSRAVFGEGEVDPLGGFQAHVPREQALLALLALRGLKCAAQVGDFMLTPCLVVNRVEE